MVQCSCLPLRKGTNPVVVTQRYAATEDLVEKPFNTGFESSNCRRGLCVCICESCFIFILVNKFESTVYILTSCPLCPLPCLSRGYLPLQSVWNLVSEREEPAGPSDVLLQRATEGARDSCGGERHRSPPDPKYLPISTMQQELLWSQGPGNTLEHFTQW